MRKQNEQVMEFIKQNFWWALGSYKEKRFWKSLEVLVRNNAFKIYMYKTCIVSYSGLSHDVIFSNGWYETPSTAQNLKAFVEWIFGFEYLPRWKGIIDDMWHEYEWFWWEIQIEHIQHLYL